MDLLRHASNRYRLRRRCRRRRLAVSSRRDRRLYAVAPRHGRLVTVPWRRLSERPASPPAAIRLLLRPAREASAAAALAARRRQNRCRLPSRSGRRRSPQAGRQPRRRVRPRSRRRSAAAIADHPTEQLASECAAGRPAYGSTRCRRAGAASPATRGGAHNPRVESGQVHQGPGCEGRHRQNRQPDEDGSRRRRRPPSNESPPSSRLAPVIITISAAGLNTMKTPRIRASFELASDSLGQIATARVNGKNRTAT